MSRKESHGIFCNQQTQNRSEARGAPPGNTNALKHGYYSERFNGPDLSEFDFSNLQEEITLVRLSLHQLCAYKSEITTLQEASAFLRLVCTGVATLNRLMRTAALLQSSASRPHRPSYLDLILAERAALLEDDPPLDPIADPEFFPDPARQPEPEPSPGLANPPSPVALPPSPPRDLRGQRGPRPLCPRSRPRR